MKKLIGLSVFTLCLGFATMASAQEKVGHEIKKDAKKVGHKTAEVTSKGKTKITDKTYKDKVGPDGQTIYIDSKSRYFYIDKRGKRQYVTKGQLKDKPAM